MSVVDRVIRWVDRPGRSRRRVGRCDRVLQARERSSPRSRLGRPDCPSGPAHRGRPDLRQFDGDA